MEEEKSTNFTAILFENTLTTAFYKLAYKYEYIHTYIAYA